MNKFQRIYDAMAFAQTRGISKPSIKFGDYKVKLVTEGFNAGGLYIYWHGEYLAKIKGETVYLGHNKNIGIEQLEEIKSILSDPQAFAVAYGQRTGNCCICGRELTNKESVQYGIGPICMEKLGWIPPETSSDSNLLDYL